MAAVAKNVRGRPKKITDDFRELLTGIYSNRSRRTIDDMFYLHRSIELLKDQDIFLWLCDLDRMRAGEKNSFKPTILSELGRIENVDDFYLVAQELCETKPKTKTAVSLIRRFRFGDGKLDIDKLVREIVGVINRNVARHQEENSEGILTALQIVVDIVRGDHVE